jgi:hypothetical protein
MLLALIAATTIAVSSVPSRQLVYTFNIYTVTSSPQAAQAADSGTIRVDVMFVQPDNGTVVHVSEQSRGRAVQPLLTCVTYGVGLVICDPSRSVTIEEMCLLRLTGQNFLNDALVTDRRGWQFSEADGRAKEVNDFKISRSDRGVLTIPFRRLLNVSGSDGYVTTTRGSISYNADRSVPVALAQEAVTRPNGNPSDPITEHLTVQLKSDSLTSVQ